MNSDDWDQDGGGEWPSDIPSGTGSQDEWDDDPPRKSPPPGQQRRRLGPPAIAASVVGVALVGIIIVNGAGAPSPSPAQSMQPTSRPASEVAATTPPRPSPTVSPSSEVIPGGVPATVIRVVDGDTIHALVDGVDEKVRIIGLDSPETSKPGTPIECFAKEATAAAESLLAPGDAIFLQPDPTQDERDRYDRLLAHVLLSDGSLFAEQMIAGGWAVHYIYDGVPSIHASELAAAEDHARQAEAGLWSPVTCAGNEHAPSPKP